MKNMLLLTLFIVVVLVSIQLSQPIKKKIISIDGQVFYLSEARSVAQKTKGLSKIKFLDKDQGMIFYFREEQDLTFWMKDTLVPLQLIFIKKCEIVDIQEMEVEENPSDPRKKYFSAAFADKAIELNKESISKNLIGREIKELCN